MLATRRRSGRPQLSPVLVGLDGGGELVVSSRETAIKTLNLRRDPGYDLVVLSDAFFGPWISVHGQAEIVSLPQALPGLEDYYRSVQGEHPDWGEYRAAMERERRVLIRLRVEEVGPRASG